MHSRRQPSLRHKGTKKLKPPKGCTGDQLSVDGDASKSKQSSGASSTPPINSNEVSKKKRTKLRTRFVSILPVVIVLFILLFLWIQHRALRSIRTNTNTNTNIRKGNRAPGKQDFNSDQAWKQLVEKQTAKDGENLLQGLRGAKSS